MTYITAPWREEYVKKVFKMKGCIFCKALKQKNDRSMLILHKGKHNFIMLNKYPYSPGHLMIAPYKHLDSIELADTASTEEMMKFLKKCLRILRQHYDPQGFNTGMNIGRSAGAGVTDHYHLHIIPRWTGDSNFMPLIGKTKVVLEDLQTTYDHLLSYFQKKDKK
jgi:ATP adenylyltransferase